MCYFTARIIAQVAGVATNKKKNVLCILQQSQCKKLEQRLPLTSNLQRKTFRVRKDEY